MTLPATFLEMEGIRTTKRNKLTNSQITLHIKIYCAGKHMQCYNYSLTEVVAALVRVHEKI